MAKNWAKCIFERNRGLEDNIGTFFKMMDYLVLAKILRYVTKRYLCNGTQKGFNHDLKANHWPRGIYVMVHKMDLIMI